MRLDRVTKRYARRAPVVLDGVCLDLPGGSLVYLRGENGSGKSTLLRVIAGITRPTAGTVIGRSRSVGYVPERFPSGLRFTPAKYLAHLGAVRASPPPRERSRRAPMERLGMAAYQARPLLTLSKGTAQKVAVAQAFLGQPGLLVLDEAWTGLDIAAHAALGALVAERRDAGALVIFTDHRGRAQDLAPDAAYLVAGGAVTSAPVTDLGSEALRPRMRVELAGPPGALTDEAFEGVTGTRTGAGTAIAIVETSACDHFLAAMLARGCSVRRVEPAGDDAEGAG